VLDALEAMVRSPDSGADQVRRLPRVIPEILQSLRSENFSGASIAARIASDAVLVAAVIHLANRALQPGGKNIGSVEQAVIAIGHHGLRELIMKVAFRPIIDLKSGRYTRALAPRIWDQSERCALANRLLAGQYNVPPFDAFLAGLMQNVGLMVALRTMDHVAKERQVLGTTMFYTHLMRHARQLSCNIGREWGMPDTVLVAIGEQLTFRKQATLSPLGQLLALSDYLSKARQMADHNRLGAAAGTLFDGLPAAASDCYTALQSSDQTDPGHLFHGAA
jgi:HD-like signal output (HDOD) protein